MDNCSVDDWISEDDTYSFHSTFSFVINSVLVPMTAVVGIMGNLLVVWILLKSSTWRSLRIYLIMLAIWDALLLLCACSVLSVASLLQNQILPSDTKFVHAFPIAHMLYNVCFFAHIWTTIVLTVERYLAICHGLWHRRFINPKMISAVSLMVVLLLSFALAGPRYFEIVIVECYDSFYETVHATIETSQLFSQFEYRKFFRLAGSLIFSSLGPLLILLVLTFKIASKVRRGVSIKLLIDKNGKQKHKAMARVRRSRSRKLEQANRPILLVIGCSLLSHVLPFILDVLEFCTDDEQTHLITLIQTYMVPVSNLLVLINASLPFFIYAFVSKRFRLEARRCTFDRRGVMTSLSHTILTQYMQETAG